MTTGNRKEEKISKDIRKEGSPRLGDLAHDDAVIRKKVISSWTVPEICASRLSTLAWKMPWMEEPGGLQSMGSLRVGHK